MTGYAGDDGIDMGPCPHEHVVRDDDGLSRHWYVCLDCNSEVRPGEEEDEWVTVE